MNDITHLVLSGGGTKGICALGALQFMDERCMLKNIKCILGTSIGSVIGTLLCFMPVFKIIENIKLFYTISYRDINIKSLVSTFSLMSKQTFIQQIELLFYEYIKYSPTFQELFNFTGKHLIISASNITTQQTDYFEYVRYPDMQIIDAIKCSINIPIIFEKETVCGCTYIDGSVFNNFEWKYFSHIEDKKKIGIVLQSKLKKSRSNDIFLCYIINIMEACYHVIQRTIAYECNIVHISNDVPFFDIEYNEENCKSMINIGRQCAESTLNLKN